MKAARVYLRVSTDAQDLERQERIITVSISSLRRQKARGNPCGGSDFWNAGASSEAAWIATSLRASQ
jgi:hypothetical protein